MKWGRAIKSDEVGTCAIKGDELGTCAIKGDEVGACAIKGDKAGTCATPQKKCRCSNLIILETDWVLPKLVNF
jgi:hypothetical protein